MGAAKPLTREALATSAMTLLMENPLFKVSEAEIRGNTYRVFENAPPHLSGFFAHCAATHGDKRFLTYNDEHLTFAETWAHACRFAHALREGLGVNPGDKVAIAMRNYPEWCVAYMGVLAAGAVVVPLNAWWKAEELRFALEDSGAKVVVVDGKRLEFIAEFKKALGLKIILSRDSGIGADYSFDELLAKANSKTPPKIDTQPDDDFAIYYTSGSTGNPKGVVLTHRGCLSTIMSWGFIAAVIKHARDGVSPFGDDPGILLAIPLFHVTGSHSIFMLSFMVGRRIVMMRKWDPSMAVDIIKKEQLTNFVGVPSQSFELMEAAGAEGLPSLVDIGSGGAKRPAEHVKQLAEKFEQAKPSSGYGLSETNAIGCVISQDDYQERPDSTGRPVPPLTDIKIVLDDGSEAPRGTVGEVWIRSPANFREYLNLPEATTDALTPDGWFKSGDLGKMDDEDFVYIVDRIKELIIRGGENISCLEVENRVYTHPQVAEAVVFSVPDDVLGERVGLVVYPKPGEEIDPAQLREHIGRDLAAYKNPEKIWVSPAPLPRLGTAKFDKITIRKIALANEPTLLA